VHELIFVELQNVHIIYKALKDLIGPIGLKHKCSDVLNKSVFTRISTVNAFCLCVISFVLKTHMLWNLHSHFTQDQLKNPNSLKTSSNRNGFTPPLRTCLLNFFFISSLSISPSIYTAHSSLN